MIVPLFPDFWKWSPQELKKAETAAIEFLDRNSPGIADTFAKRLAIMSQITMQLASPNVGFDERMVCFALLEELSKGLGESARGFFEIGCVPSVANLMRR